MILCIMCHKPNDDPSHKVCPECRRKQNRRSRIKRVERMKNGLCIYCGKEPPTEGTNECDTCRSYRLNKKQSRIESGICARCGKRPINKNRSDSMCTECLDYYKIIMRGS